MKKIILACPAGYYLDEVHSSEDHWPVRIMDSVSKQSEYHYIAVTNLAKLYSDYNGITIFTFQKKPSTTFQMLERLIFIFRYSFKGAWLIIKYKPVIFHHILPFGQDKTFNPVVWIAKLLRIPVIIGPLQAAHTFDEFDEFNVFMRDFHSRRKASSFISRLNKFLLSVSPLFLKFLSIRTLESANCLIAVNAESRNIYSSSAPKVRSLVIPPGINIAEYLYTDPPERTEVIILSAGYMMKRKGFDVLLKAFCQLYSKYPNLRLRIIGKGPEEKSLKAYCEQNGLEQVVEFVGFVPHPEMPTQIADCDIFCLASHSDIFPNVLVEAMSSGRPLVATKSIGGRSIIEDGKQGWLAEVNDPNSLAIALEKLVINEQQRLEIGRRNRVEAVECYDWGKIGQRYIDEYNKLLSYQI